MYHCRAERCSDVVGVHQKCSSVRPSSLGTKAVMSCVFQDERRGGMSRANKQLSKQLITLARKSGGSFKTVSDRARIASRFAESMYVEIKYPDTRCQ